MARSSKVPLRKVEKLESRVQAAYEAYRNATDPAERRRKFDTYRFLRDREEQRLLGNRFSGE